MSLNIWNNNRGHITGATEILIEADLDLSESLTTMDIEKLMDTLEDRVRRKVPKLHRVRFLLNSPTQRKW